MSDGQGEVKEEKDLAQQQKIAYINIKLGLLKNIINSRQCMDIYQDVPNEIEKQMQERKNELLKKVGNTSGQEESISEGTDLSHKNQQSKNLNVIDQIDEADRQRGYTIQVAVESLQSEASEYSDCVTTVITNLK